MKIRNLVSAASLCVASQSHAHHGIVNFDLNRDLELRGVITDIAFVNPHAWLYLEVADEDGTVTPWRCELRSATVLRRSGWSPEMFEAGQEVRVTGAPDRSAATDCYLSTIEFADGRSMDRYGMLRDAVPVTPPAERAPRLANGDPNISGAWAGEQRVMTDPRGLTGTLVPLSVARTLDGELPPGMRSFPGARGTPESLADDPIRAAWSRPSAMPLTQAGQQAIEDFDPASSDNPRLRCEPTNIIFDWMFDTPVHRITQHEDRITIEYGTVGGLNRTVYMSSEGTVVAPPDGWEPSLAGHSVGRWEGDVLIVETTGFAAGILSADGYTPHSDQLQVVERFSLDTDTWALTRDYVAEDPLYFLGQYTGSDTVYPADLPFEPDACDDRSFRILTGGGEAEHGVGSEPVSDPVRRPWWRFRD